jgi:hypothetical protein
MRIEILQAIGTIIFWFIVYRVLVKLEKAKR